MIIERKLIVPGGETIGVGIGGGVRPCFSHILWELVFEDSSILVNSEPNIHAFLADIYAQLVTYREEVVDGLDLSIIA